MAELTVVARVLSKEAALEEVKAELVKLVAPTRQEKGCITYTLHQDQQNPCLFIFYENWENAACLESHLQSSHFKAYIAAVEGLIADKVVQRLTRIA